MPVLGSKPSSTPIALPERKPSATPTVLPVTGAKKTFVEPYSLLLRTAMGMEHEGIGIPPTDVETILALEQKLLFRAFTADTAFALGTHLRNRLHAISPIPCFISITLSSSPPQTLFAACSHPGTTPDNSEWARRKLNTVLRFGRSSWYMGRKFDGDHAKFAEKYGLFGDKAGEYAIHGGGVPVRVEGVEGVVAVVVVSGLSQAEDHQVVVESLEDCIQEMKSAGGGPLKA